MTELQLICLGNFQVTLAGRALTAFQTDKARALLAYLLIEDRTHARSELAQFLWAGYGKESALNSLRQTLHQLRQLLHNEEANPPWLLLTRQTVQLNPAAAISVDVKTFSRLLGECKTHSHAELATCASCLARLHQAIELYQGDFLAGLTVVDSDPFEEWRRILQEQLHIQMLDALTRLADAAESAGDDEGALQAAQRQLALEPWLEVAHRQIMRILAQRGQRAAALAQYQRCCQVLAEELGVKPEAETTALYEQIQRGNLAKATLKRTLPQAALGQAHTSVTLAPNVPIMPTSVPVHNLPRFPTPLVGRAQALAELAAQLQRPAVRLLTLVGPGGMGKTRLAVEVGHERLAAFADGVFFVPLAPISGSLPGADALAPAIANALGLTLQGGDPQSVLCQLLSQKQLLLILDNFEHLLAGGVAPNTPPSVDAVELVMALLDAAPGLQIIVTSRERLKLRDEHTYTVPALTFSTTASLAEAHAAAAVRLFVQSVQRMQSDFQLTAANLPAVLRICYAVQGMPLGLELAAANARGAPLSAIADALEQSAEVLSVDWRELPERQRSMRAVFAWSWQLLSAEEQHILRQSAVFRGGFTYAAVQAVTGATLPLLTRLVDKSLLQWQATATGEGRYAFHELLRQFAAEHLAASAAEQEKVTAQHSEFYLHYLAVRERRLTRAEPRAAAAELQMELDNIRQAWQCAVQRQAFFALQRSAWTLFSFYRHTGALAEGSQAFQVIADQVPLPAQPAQTFLPQLHDPPRSRLLAIYAYLLVFQNKFEQASVVAQQALALAQAEGDTDAAALSQLSWGQVLRFQGRLDDAQLHFEQTLQLAHLTPPANDKSELLYDVECLAEIWLGGVNIDRGFYAKAHEPMLRSLHLAQMLGKRRMEMMALVNLATLAYLEGAYPTAQQGYEAGLRLAREVGYRWGEAVSQYELGHTLRRQGEYSRAITLMENALTIFQEIGEHFRKANALIALGQLSAYLGDFTAAEAWLTRYQQFVEQAKVREATIHLLEARTVLALNRGEAAQALAYATKGWQLGQNGNPPEVQAYALIGMGHAQRQLGKWAAAATAYQQAFALYTGIQRPDLAAEAQAGLAAIAQQQGDPQQALERIEAVLAQLAKQSISGHDEPFFLYLTCYQLLAAAEDPRALPILQQGYALLQRYAEQISAEALRRSFLENVPVHRALQQAYTAAQARKPTTPSMDDVRSQDQMKEGARLVSILPAAAPPADSVPLPPLLDWGDMPAVDFLTGRSAELAQLTAWLAPPVDAKLVPARLISVLGIGGIGKTTLVAAVTKAVAPSFSVVIWRSLLNAPPLTELLRNWLHILSRQTLPTLPEALDEQLRLLLGYLRQARCLLVLDNVESLFVAADPHGRAGATRPGYEGYDQLFQRLGSSEHQSCLLLTSREQPYALNRLGRQAQETTGRIQVLALSGLDHQAGQMLLQSNGLYTSAAAAAQLIDHYSGNPLALQIVAATIADFFGGDVTAFQQEAGTLFDGMRLVLDQQFARLSPLERDILVWLAIEREAVSVQTLRSNLVQPVSTRDLLEALHALQNRSLLEKRDAGLTLQNVIIEYTTEYLVEQVCQALVGDEEPGRQGDKERLINPISSSFLNRFALLKAQAREEVRQSQARLILQPVANRMLALIGKAQLEARVMALVQQWQAAGVTPGYAGGNLLNLLLHIGSDLRGRDFSHLALWQVFLAGAYVPGLNLVGADLTGAVFTQRFSPLFSFHFDAQGDLLLAEIRDQRLRLLRLHDGRLYKEIGLPALRILDVELSPDCSAVLMHLAENQLALLDLTTEQLFPALARHQHNIWRFCFSPDGRLVASGDSRGLICIWDRQSGQLVQERQISTDAVSALALAPDGVTVASANVAGTVFLWSLTDQTALRRLQGHDEEVATLTFLDNGALLASGSHDMTIGLWDVATGELRQYLRGHTRPIRKSTATAMGQWLVTGGGDHFLYVWDWQRGAPLHLLTDHAAAIDRLVISADGKRAATIDLNAVVSLWDLAQGRRLDFYPIYHNAIMSIQFTPNGDGLVSGGSDGAVYLWQLQEGVGARMTARLTAQKQRIFAVAVHPDGNLIASAGDGFGVALWARNSGRLLQTLQSHVRNIAMLAISPDGQWLASGNGDSTVSVWSLPDGRQRRQLQGHTNMVSCCAFSPRRVDTLGRPQQRLASGSFDHTVAIWDAETGDLLRHLHGHTNAIGRCVFSHDGQRLISCSYDETLRIWDVESGQPLAVWPQSHGGYIALALHPAGEILAVSCYDHMLCLFELKSGRCLAELVGHSQIVVALAFHPNGQWLASAGADETIKLWDFSADALNRGQVVCRHTLQTPTPYAGMKIAGITGVSEAQKAALRALGAVEV